MTEKRRYFEDQVLYDLLGQAQGQNDANRLNSVSLFLPFLFLLPFCTQHINHFHPLASKIWRLVDQAVTLAEARQLLSASTPVDSLLGLTHNDLVNKVFINIILVLLVHCSPYNQS